MTHSPPIRKILILGTNPKDTDKLRLDEEVRDIKERLRQAKDRDCFAIDSEWALRPRDIQQAILNFQPEIIHFSGHGFQNGGLAFEDENGKAQLVTPEALAGLFKLFSSHVKCVVLNACYAEIQAIAICQHISSVIGMKQSIGDKAAIEFAVGFYGALGAGKSIERAFEFGRSAIEMAGIKGYSVPVLKQRSLDIRPSNQESSDPQEEIEDLGERDTTLEAPSRTEYEFVMTGRLDEESKRKIEAIFAHLQKITGDTSLTLLRVEEGSIKFVLEGSEDGFKKLEELIKSGQLSEIEGMAVEDIRDLKTIQNPTKPELLGKKSDGQARAFRVRSVLKQTVLASPTSYPYVYASNSGVAELSYDSAQSLTQPRQDYLYDLLALSTQGPFRLFPHFPHRDVNRFYVQELLTELRDFLVEQGIMPKKLDAALEMLQNIKANQIQPLMAKLIADGILPAELGNAKLPPGETLSAEYIRDLTTMKQSRDAALAAAQAKPSDQREAFYRTLEGKGHAYPKVAKRYAQDGDQLSDCEFVWQRLAGANPVMLYRVQDTNTHPLSRLGALRSVSFQGQQIDLNKAVAEGRLFAVDYPLLDFDQTELQPGRYVGNPLALFYRSEQDLEPLLIQVEPQGEVYTSQDGDDWMRAKLYVQTADVTYHELMTHLCFTHLAMEAFAIATPRQLPSDHPVHRLLKPHFKFLLATNARGAEVLLSAEGEIAKLLAPTLDASKKRLNRGYRQRLFSSYALPRDIEQRGVSSAHLPDYPYRDDAQLLWETIESYVSAYLHRNYASDLAICNDAYLQEWAAELGEPLSQRPEKAAQEFAQTPWLLDQMHPDEFELGELPDYPKVPGFPSRLETRSQLVEILTTVIFVNTAQHSAVNFSQLDYLSHAPSAPMAAYAFPNVPATLEQQRPNTEKELQQMLLTFTLSGLLWGELGVMEAAPDHHDILRDFRECLQKVEMEITDRNQKRLQDTEREYPYLLPSRITNSINI